MLSPRFHLIRANNIVKTRGTLIPKQPDLYEEITRERKWCSFAVSLSLCKESCQVHRPDTPEFSARQQLQLLGSSCKKMSPIKCIGSPRNLPFFLTDAFNICAPLLWGQPHITKWQPGALFQKLCKYLQVQISEWKFIHALNLCIFINLLSTFYPCTCTYIYVGIYYLSIYNLSYLFSFLPNC